MIELLSEGIALFTTIGAVVLLSISLHKQVVNNDKQQKDFKEIIEKQQNNFNVIIEKQNQLQKELLENTSVMVLRNDSSNELVKDKINFLEEALKNNIRQIKEEIFDIQKKISTISLKINDKE